MVGATETRAQMINDRDCEVLPIAAVLNDGDGAVYTLIAEAANLLQKEGWQVAGVVQAGDSRQALSACDMMLTVLPDGPQIGIAQNLGEGATGCRLDQAALEDVVGLVDRSLDETPQLLVLNKFGHRESEGAGFRQTIARAVTKGIPVLVGISKVHLPAFSEFAGDDAPVLPAKMRDVLAWCRHSAT